MHADVKLENFCFALNADMIKVCDFGASEHVKWDKIAELDELPKNIHRPKGTTRFASRAAHLKVVCCNVHYNTRSNNYIAAARSA